MTKRADDAYGSTNVRVRAEEKLRETSARPLRPSDLGDRPHDLIKLVHELQVHQIELEMQNEELARAREAAEQALEKYSELYDFAPVGYFTVARDSTIRRSNLTGAKILGVERGRLVGTRLGVFVSDAYSRAFYAMVENAHERELDGSCDVTLAPRPNERGEPRYLQINVSAAKGGDECRVIAVDISERRRAEAQQRASQKMETIGHLARGLAAEFAGALTEVLEEAEAGLASVPSTEVVEQHVVAMRSAGVAAVALVRQIEGLARKPAGKLQVAEANELARGVVGLLGRALGNGIEVVLTLARDAGRIECEPAEFEQVILNLAINARDAMPAGGRLTLATSNVSLDETDVARGIASKPGIFVALSVSDSGVGIDAAILPRIFDTFFTTRRNAGGAGLGLSTARGIVKRWGGGIAVRSAVGVGTTFEVFFPRTIASAT